MSVKKIAMVCGTIGPRFGGQGLSSLLLCHALVKAGYHVSLFTLPGGYNLEDFKSLSPALENGTLRIKAVEPPNLYNWIDRKQQPGWKKALWHTVNTWNPLAYRMFLKHFQSIQPDAIVITRIRGFSAAVMSSATRSCPGRVLKVVNDYEVMAPEATLRFEYDPKRYFYRTVIPLYKMIRRRSTRGVNCLVSPSRYTLEKHIREGFFPDAVPVVIPNTHGYTLNQVESLKQHRPDSGPFRRFLYLGRLEPEKGIAWLCRVFDEISRMYHDLQLNIAGWGTLVPELVKIYGDRPWFRFHGRVSGEQKERLLQESDVMVVPSLWPEVFGIVCVEAFAHGLPVIATRAGGLPEVVRDGETGLLVTPGDDEDLARAIGHMIRLEQNDRDVFRKACNQEARKFTLESFESRYREIIDYLLSSVSTSAETETLASIPGRAS